MAFNTLILMSFSLGWNSSFDTRWKVALSNFFECPSCPQILLFRWIVVYQWRNDNTCLWKYNSLHYCQERVEMAVRETGRRRTQTKRQMRQGEPYFFFDGRIDTEPVFGWSPPAHSLLADQVYLLAALQIWLHISCHYIIFSTLTLTHNLFTLSPCLHKWYILFRNPQLTCCQSSIYNRIFSLENKKELWVWREMHLHNSVFCQKLQIKMYQELAQIDVNDYKTSSLNYISGAAGHMFSFEFWIENFF